MPNQEIEIVHDAIKSFWFTERVFSPANSRFEVLPDSFAELIFFFGAVCSLQKSDSACTELTSPFLVGLLDKPLLFKIEGHIHIFAVRFYPWAAFPFLTLKPKTNDNIFLTNHRFNRLTIQLRQKMEQTSIAEALQLLQNYFLQEIKAESSHDSVLQRAGHTIVNNKGSLSIKQLAENCHVSPRTLQRNFIQSSGNSAKAIARKVRFEVIRDYIWFHPEYNLSQLAYEYDFADQAHFNHEFKYFSGKTPGAFAREALEATAFFRAENVAFIQDFQK